MNVLDQARVRAHVRFDAPGASWPTFSGLAKSPQFRRMIELPGRRLPDALAALPAAAASGRRLRLAVPQATAGGGWTVDGRLRWLTRPLGVPVRVDLWPHLDGWTMCTLQPNRRVHPTRAYFRSGNRALDRLSAGLFRRSLRT